MKLRQGLRTAGKALGASALGYGVYTASVQIEARRQIRKREELSDVTERYAPIKVLGRYVNPFPEYRHQTLFEFGFRRISELFALHPPGNVPVDPALLAAALPLYTPNFVVPDSKLALTWIGQSCAVAQMPGGVTLLTDPMFSNFVVSPRVGPQRLVPPPCTPEQVPTPDVVLVSHDHQDHLDLAAAPYFCGEGTTWVVPEGVAKHLPEHARFIEMSWWERIPMPNVDPKLGYEIACTPAMHWSGRKLYDSNTSLWCSFLVLRNGKPLFFHGGDTGYCSSMFEAIAKAYGLGCEVAMIPCGAYHPRWHLKAQHMSPAESVATAQNLGAKNLIGVHWGTFIMSEEPFNEPPRKLLEDAAAGGIENVVAPQFGKTVLFNV